MTVLVGDPAERSAHRFRAILTAMSEPGRVVTAPADLEAEASPPLSTAAAAAIETLVDADAPLWLGASRRTPAIERRLRFATGASPLEARERAAYACGEWRELAPVEAFALGDPEYPDRSTTLIVEVARLSENGPILLRGPGVPGARRFGFGADPDETRAFVAALQENRERFPLGVDMLLTAGDRLLGLPRSVVADIA